MIFICSLFIFKNNNLYKLIISVQLYIGNQILVSVISNSLSGESTKKSSESTIDIKKYFFFISMESTYISGP